MSDANQSANSQPAILSEIMSEFLQTRTQEQDAVPPSTESQPVEQSNTAQPSESVQVKEVTEATETSGQQQEHVQEDTQQTAPAAEKADDRDERIAHVAAKAAAASLEPLLQKLSQAQSAASQSRAQSPSEQDAQVSAVLADIEKQTQRRLPILKKLEDLYPQKYRGVAEKYVDAQTKIIEYITQWEREHPGQTFVPEEHADALAKYGVEIEPEEYAEAAAEYAAEVAESKTRDAYTKAYEYAAKASEWVLVQPKIAAEIAQFEQDIIKTLAKDIASLQNVATLEDVKHLETADPVAFDVLTGVAAQHIEPALTELAKLFRGYGQPDPNNPFHKYIDRVISTLANQLQPGQLDAKGRRYAPYEEYVKLKDRSRYWTIDEEVVRSAIMQDAADIIKSAYKAERSKYERWLGRKPTAPEQKRSSSPSVPPSTGPAPGSNVQGELADEIFRVLG